MRLHKGDTIVLDKGDEMNQVVIVKKISPSAGNEDFSYFPVNLSTKAAGMKLQKLLFRSLLKYNVRKAHVDVLGRLRVGQRG